MERVWSPSGAFVLFLVATAALPLGAAVPDFNLHEPDSDFHFLYHSQYNLLLTLHGYSCYAAHMDDRIQDPLLQDFRFKLEEVVKAVVLGKDRSRMRGVTGADFRNEYGDPLADMYCLDKDIYLIQLDYLACDFERYQTPCAWTPDYSHQLQWRMHRGPTPSALTGPDVDHTLQTEQGQFIYMEANEGAAGELAELNSPTVALARNESLCLRFWYSMYGDDVESLHVLAKYGPGTAAGSRALWSMSRNQGIGWKLAEVTVPAEAHAPGQVRLTLRAHRGSSHYGDIAVDDISSAPGICAPALLNCSFEHPHLCHWTQLKTDDMDWKRSSTTTGTAGTGPNGPLHLHSPATANSYYLYMDGDEGQAGAKAELVSPDLNLQGPICLTFYYFMKGDYLGELEVVQVGENGRENIQFIRTSADQTTHWTHAKVTITAPDPDSPIQLKFRAVRGGSPSSDIAIDLVAGLSGSCDQYPDVGPTPSVIG